MTTALVWYRRDLRLSDNPALVDAVHAADEVVGVFCLDPLLLSLPGTLASPFCIDACAPWTNRWMVAW